VRYKLALEYLQKTTLPISEISLLLGYSNPANFRRTFKRWSGQKPSQVRDTT
jgi:AraC-like DNA-binding protein